MKSPVALVVLFALPLLAGDGRTAFRPLRLPQPSKLEKQVVPRLPKAIVIEAAPFDRLVASLLEPYGEQLERREKAIRGLEGGRLLSAFKVLDKERADLEKRIAGVEASYAEVYNRGYMESGEKARRARKLAAVLVPFYRTLLLRNDRTAAAAAPGAAALSARSPRLRAAAIHAAAERGERDAVKRAVTGDLDAVVRGEALLALLRFKVGAIQATVIAALGDESWRVRAAAVAICVRGKLVEATGPLIDALGKEEGRLRSDIDDALFALTGVRMYGDVALWKDWWSANRDAIARKARALEEAGAYDKVLGPPGGGGAAAGAEESKRKGATSAFYGIPTQSLRIVFIIDISRSMQDPAEARPAATTGRKKDAYPAPAGGAKLDIAKWQLHRAVADLPPEARFDIVVYSESYKAWAPEPVRATPRQKKKAHKFIDQLNGNGTTNISDALDKAIALGPDTIFLLSDGVTNRGRVSDLDALLEEVAGANRRARLVIHTVGIGEAAGSTFLRELARRTGGHYVGFR